MDAVPDSPKVALLGRVLTCVFLAGVLGLLGGCARDQGSSALSGGVRMRLTSPEFENNGKMPSKFASERGGGENVSPALEWGDIPEGTQSMLLVVVDRNPVANDFVHWAVKDISPDATGVAANASRADMPQGAVELKNTAGKVGWSGPTPPPGSGVHRYEFDLIALDTRDAGIPEQPSIDEVTKAVDGHVLGVGELNGMFGE